MKTQPSNKKTGTFEDLIFEGRNKSYGAFELKQKRSRYILFAFLVSITAISTSIAVPFIKAFKGEGVALTEKDFSRDVDLARIDNSNDVLLPPPPPKLEIFEKSMIRNLAPVIVTEANENLDLMINADLIDKLSNEPVHVDPFPAYSASDVIPEIEVDTVVLFPSEPASFMGGDMSQFRAWVGEHLKYPEEAARENIFGKVIIEFCVSKKGEVVDIKVLRSLHPSVDQAAIEVILSSPRWVPAKQGGNPVKTKYIFPLVFDLI